MKKNMGAMDRSLRTLVAFVLGILILTGNITGTLAIVLGIVAVVFLLTSAISFCPLYMPFRISTAKKEK